MRMPERMDFTGLSTAENAVSALSPAFPAGCGFVEDNPDFE
jgi:hypothetical protein